ncbi:ABC transporter permease [Lysobacter sp. GX 14042]|uniref:ABC transporter permease n=1 Tax=Lysobacter sp. GX 14042 TaxID=2907155 RepID=UPI001F16EFDE|nr:ABC transporter permease [Lysobacter sp. GX 14042]MCE7032042.1 ABC transporter permease [Lysobacter sp. GX 14042]
MNAIADANLHRPRQRMLRSYLLEAKYEFLRLLRAPMFSLPTLLFPAMFYLLFGVVMNRGNPAAATYLFATYGVFGVMGAALFGFGVTVAMDRERGLLTLKRALPMPPGAYLLGKMAMAAMFGLMVASLLAALAALAGGVSLRPAQWALLLLVHVAGAVPFGALGLYIGTLSSGGAAPAVVNLVYLPLSLLSGLWLPLAMLPGVFATLAPAWPPYHVGQLALKVVGMDAGQPVALHLGVLALVSAGFFALARARLVRNG